MLFELWKTYPSHPHCVAHSKFHSASSNWWSMLLWEVLACYGGHAWTWSRCVYCGASPWWAWPQTSPSREFRRPCLLGNARAGVSVWDLVPHSQAQEFPWPQSTKHERMRLWVMDVHYTQKAISKRFRDGRWLEELIRDLYMWNVDPCNHSNMCLEVVKYQEHFYSNDNRRLFCLRKHQLKVGRDRVAGVGASSGVQFWPLTQSNEGEVAGRHSAGWWNSPGSNMIQHGISLVVLNIQ